MTNDLLSTVDLARFQAKDPQWFLDAVAGSIVDHCGWHICPVTSFTGYRARIGNKGTIVLPTLKLVSVEQVSINYWGTPTVWDASGYSIDEAGVIDLGVFGRRLRNVEVTVDYTSGYDETPTAVAEVGYELTATVLEKPSGVVTDLQRGPTRMTFKEFGVVLSDDQKDRLGPYTLPGVG